MGKKYIDVSCWQPEIDWAEVKADGVDGVIIRAGFGRFDGQKDSMFEAHYKGAKAVGLPVGAYHYSYAKTAAQAEQEAVYFMQLIKGKTLELPVVYDIEDKTQAGLGKQVITDMILAFCEKVEKAGYYVMVYANLHWLENKIEYDRIKRFDIWVAQYYKECQFKKPFGMWQYTSTGTVKGIKGGADMNIAYFDYPARIKGYGCNGFSKPQPSKPPTPNKPAPPTAIKKGDRVRVKNGAKTFDKKSIAGFVYNNTYAVDELKGGRAVLGMKTICTAVKVGDLIKV